MSKEGLGFLLKWWLACVLSLLTTYLKNILRKPTETNEFPQFFDDFSRMNEFCLICDVKVGASQRSTSNIFTEYTNTNSEQTFSCGSTANLLSEILDKTLTEDGVHSNVICKKCHKICTEYESIKLRSQVIKNEFAEQFKNTLDKHSQSYETFNEDVTVPSPVKTADSTPKKIVLPASKLQPLPPGYILNVSKLSGLKVGIPKIAPSTSTTPKTVTPSVQTRSIAKAKSTIQNSTINESSILDSNCITTILNTKSTNSVLSFNVNSLPKDFLTSNVVLTKLEDELMKKEDDNLDNNDDDDEDDESMEIDADCTLVRVTAVNDFDDNSDKDNSSDKSQYIDVVPLDKSESDRILGKIVLKQEGNDHGQTIVMTQEDGDILRVVSGQKLVYENGEISIIDDDGDDDDDNSNQDDDYNDDDGGHDSNEESQIELQVSGDEETANAIIAAAQEQGGAFIKVESGEMYRVKSVKSKTAETSIDTQALVTEENGVYKCVVCANGDPLSTPVTGDADAIMQHLKVEHDARLYICRICKKFLRKRIDYLKHFEEHTTSCNTSVNPNDKVKYHECNLCKKKYNSRTLLSEHMNVHSGVRPYCCNVCNKAFSSKYTLQAHLKTHSERPRPFKCTKCPKSFLSQQNLNQHVKTHSGVKDFICNVCNKAFGTQHNLEVHSIVHTGNKPFLCGVCGKGFARRAEVKDHMRIHTGERPFSCDICGATFAQRSNLHTHKRGTHLNEKRYQCTQCPKRFKRRRLLDYHIQGSHTGERPLQCEVCHATFVYPEHYKKHIRIHSGEKPFICEVCGKSFNSRDNRNTHRFTHSDKKPYECLVCGAGFMRKQLLYAHMNSAGHIAESIVVNQPRVQKITSINVDAIQKPDKLQAIFENSDLEMNTSGIRGDDKPTVNITQETEEATILSLQNLDSSKNDASMLLQTITAEQLGDQSQMLASDEKGEMVRLVQVQLEDGNSGWMAIAQ